MNRQTVRVTHGIWIAIAGLVCAAAALPAHGMLPIQHWQTSNGAQVYFVESHDLPMLDVSVEFPAGSGRDKPATSGLAALTLRALRLGADGLSEDEVSRHLADVGANLGSSFDYDRAGYSIRTLSSEAEMAQSLDILARILHSPTFPADNVEREKLRTLAGLREADAKPDAMGGRELARLVFRDHPYALRQSGEKDTLAALTRADLAGFYAVHYAARDAVVAMIGDVSRQRAELIAEQLTQGLPKAAALQPALPPVAALSDPVVRELEHPSAQAHIYLGAPGVKRSDADYFPLWVGNYILGGGGFNSRLTAEVREKRGLSYSVYSYFSPYEQLGTFQVGLQTRKDQADEALRVTRATLAQFIAQGPTAKELEGAKQNIVGGFPLRIDSNRKILDYLAVIGFYRLSLDYLEQFPIQVQAVTAEQIREAFARRIDPDKMVTVIVGGAHAK